MKESRYYCYIIDKLLLYYFLVVDDFDNEKDEGISWDSSIVTISINLGFIVKINIVLLHLESTIKGNCYIDTSNGEEEENIVSKIKIF